MRLWFVSAAALPDAFSDPTAGSLPVFSVCEGSWLLALNANHPVDIFPLRRHICRPKNHPPSGGKLANSPQARKRARQAEKRRVHNASQRSMVRTYIKRVNAAIAAGNAADAGTAYAEAVPLIDKMVSKGIMHKNKAARHKSRLNKQIQALNEA